MQDETTGYVSVVSPCSLSKQACNPNCFGSVVVPAGISQIQVKTKSKKGTAAGDSHRDGASRLVCNRNLTFELTWQIQRPYWNNGCILGYTVGLVEFCFVCIGSSQVNDILSINLTVVDRLRDGNYFDGYGIRDIVFFPVANDCARPNAYAGSSAVFCYGYDCWVLTRPR